MSIAVAHTLSVDLIKKVILTHSRAKALIEIFDSSWKPGTVDTGRNRLSLAPDVRLIYEPKTAEGGAIADVAIAIAGPPPNREHIPRLVFVIAGGDDCTGGSIPVPPTHSVKSCTTGPLPYWIVSKPLCKRSSTKVLKEFVYQPPMPTHMKFVECSHGS